MEKNDKSCPKDVCEKVYQAVCTCPAFKKMRHISHRPNESRQASPAPYSSPPAPSVKTIDIDPKTESPKHLKSVAAPQPHKSKDAVDDVVEINYDFSSQPASQLKPKSAISPLESTPKTGQVTAVPSSKISPQVAPPNMTVRQETKASFKAESPPEPDIEDRFTNYINRARNKLRSLSNAGDHGKKASGKDKSGKDKFSDYIKQTKVKIRTTSTNIGRSITFK